MPKQIAISFTCGLLIAACGSSVKPATTAARRGPLLQLSRCMRAHGVPNFPDPNPSGGIQLGPNEGIDPQSPTFQSAQRACRKFAPGAGPVSARASAQAKAQLLQISECMRRHGISDFPDPSTGSPPSSPAGYSIVLGRPGAFIAVPSSINPQSPAFRQAAAACQFGLRGAPKGG